MMGITAHVLRVLFIAQWDCNATHTHTESDVVALQVCRNGEETLHSNVIRAGISFRSDLRLQ